MAAHPFAQSNRATAARMIVEAVDRLDELGPLLSEIDNLSVRIALGETLRGLAFRLREARTVLGRADEIDRMADRETIPAPSESGAREVSR